MKKMMMIFFIFVSLMVHAQDENPYLKAMKQGIQTIDSAKNMNDFASAANQFDRISQIASNDWLPLYYAAYSYIIMSYIERKGDKKDQYCDKAQTYIDKALTLMPNESEIWVIQGMLHQARISVSPMTRGQKYGQLAGEALEEAKRINPENPRIYYLIGQNMYYTPKMFGGGTEAAKPYLQEASVKFRAFKPISTLYPVWGSEDNDTLLVKCSK